MAAPIRGTQRPARRRSPTDLLIGLLATAALLALTAGVPLALVAVFGLPVPHSVPKLSVLTHQLDVFSILRVLSVAVWLAWLQLVGCVIAEVRAAVRNTGMPARVPLAGGTQALVHRLVTAALLTFAATAALSPALTQPVSPQATHQASQPARLRPGTRASTAPGRHAASAPELASPPVLAGPPQVAHSPFGAHARHHARAHPAHDTHPAYDALPSTPPSRTRPRNPVVTRRTKIRRPTAPARCGWRRSTSCSPRPAGFTRACGRSRRSSWATAAGTRRSSK